MLQPTRLWIVMLSAGLASTASAQLELIGSFNPGEGGSMNSIGFNPDRDEIVVHFNGSASVHVYDRGGNFLRSFAKPSGVGGNDDDLDFADEAVDVNGVMVPAHSLFVIENDNDPPRIVAADAVTGAVLAQQNFSGSAIGQWTGGAYHHDRNTFFCSDWTGDVIQEVDASDGSILNQFPIVPDGAPHFDFFYSDVEAHRADGMIYLVSSSQQFIRVLSPEGAYIGDFPFGGFGMSGMSGIAFDDERGEAWISSTNGNVYHLGGFEVFAGDPCSDADLSLPFGVLDFFDVQQFLQLFSAQDDAADMNDDQVFDFFDVLTFLQLFSAGCP